MQPYKGSIRDQADFKILFENPIMMLGHSFETAYTINKIDKEENAVFEFDNDPTCGLIGKNNDWCLVGGDILVLKTWCDHSIRIFSELKHIHALRAANEYSIQILTDPWSDQPAIWQMEMDLDKLTRPVNLHKLKDFTDYVGKPYQEEVVW